MEGEDGSDRLGHIRVAVRVRPLPAGEEGIIEVAGSGAIAIEKEAATGGNEHLRSQQGRVEERAFDRVFGPLATQAEVYEWTCAPLVEEAVAKGKNATVFVYGATGAGKTYTMFGDAPKAQQGVIFRGVRDVFKRVEAPSADDGGEFQVKVSFLELYNENVNDLLQEHGGGGLCKVLEDERKGIVKVQHLREVDVRSADEALQHLEAGMLARTIEATAANFQSSRAHAAFTLNIERVRTQQGRGTFNRGAGQEVRQLHSRICFIDLAGSERAKATRNSGTALKDGARINQSLLALANCIDALTARGREKIPTIRKKAPYRDSKLTLMLKSSLTGEGLVSMIANVHPGRSHFEDSNNTLEYAKRASSVRQPAARRFSWTSAPLSPTGAGSTQQGPPTWHSQQRRAGPSPVGRPPQTHRGSRQTEETSASADRCTPSSSNLPAHSSRRMRSRRQLGGSRSSLASAEDAVAQTGREERFDTRLRPGESAPSPAAPGSSCPGTPATAAAPAGPAQSGRRLSERSLSELSLSVHDGCPAHEAGPDPDSGSLDGQGVSSPSGASFAGEETANDARDRLGLLRGRLDERDLSVSDASAVGEEEMGDDTRDLSLLIQHAHRGDSATTLTAASDGGGTPLAISEGGEERWGSKGMPDGLVHSGISGCSLGSASAAADASVVTGVSTPARAQPLLSGGADAQDDQVALLRQVIATLQADKVQLDGAMEAVLKERDILAKQKSRLERDNERLRATSLEKDRQMASLLARCGGC